MQDFSEKSIFPLGRGTVVLSVLCGFIVNGSVDLLAAALLITTSRSSFSSAQQEEEGRRRTRVTGGKPKVKLKWPGYGAAGSGTSFSSESSERARIEFCCAHG
uniref:(northern house mosquito) hypothetical protein n=1 Tax=Culex pipiens TaxID=7175 RepID=A0A8D8J788_CULPI